MGRGYYNPNVDQSVGGFLSGLGGALKATVYDPTVSAARSAVAGVAGLPGEAWNLADAAARNLTSGPVPEARWQAPGYESVLAAMPKLGADTDTPMAKLAEFYGGLVGPANPKKVAGGLKSVVEAMPAGSGAMRPAINGAREAGAIYTEPIREYARALANKDRRTLSDMRGQFGEYKMEQAQDPDYFRFGAGTAGGDMQATADKYGTDIAHFPADIAGGQPRDIHQIGDQYAEIWKGSDLAARKGKTDGISPFLAQIDPDAQYAIINAMKNEAGSGTARRDYAASLDYLPNAIPGLKVMSDIVTERNQGRRGVNMANAILRDPGVGAKIGINPEQLLGDFNMADEARSYMQKAAPEQVGQLLGDNVHRSSMFLNEAPERTRMAAQGAARDARDFMRAGNMPMADEYVKDAQQMAGMHKAYNALDLDPFNNRWNGLDDAASQVSDFKDVAGILHKIDTTSPIGDTSLRDMAMFHHLLRGGDPGELRHLYPGMGYAEGGAVTSPLAAAASQPYGK